MSILDRIHGHSDLAGLSKEEQTTLCRELRNFLIRNVSKTGGHLASNLGVVELSVAIETVFDTQTDRLVFDVGHQSYVHKILTDRKELFGTLRQFGGISGFPKPSESQTDAFVAGHASNSVSVALGMARARTLCGHNYHVLSIIGDGATTGGLAYEGLNDAGASREPLIVILNDNEMSIAQNVGAVAQHLSRIRMKPGYFGIKKAYRTVMHKFPLGPAIYRGTKRVKDWVKNRFLDTTIFEDMGFTYMGPIDGHDLTRMIELLEIARDMACPVLFHVITKKGCGYKPAEDNPSRFHGVGPFEPETGAAMKTSSSSYSSAFGTAMVRLGKEVPNLCAITAAMPSGTGLTPFREVFPDRTFDVGIAEGHAVSMAGGMAKQGLIPVVAVYSTFLQRAYDMIIQDVAMMNLHVVFAVDRAGLVGDDGETHHGLFDIGFLRQIPGLTLLCPCCCQELEEMLEWAIKECTGPVAVRYPRGGDGSVVTTGRSMVMREGSDLTILTYGTMINQVMSAVALLDKQGIHPEVLRLRTIKPLDLETIAASVRKTGRLLVVEETVAAGSVGYELANALNCMGVSAVFRTLNIGDRFVTHGSVHELYRMLKLDAESIASQAREVLLLES